MYGQSGITSFWDSGKEKTTVNDPKNVEALEKYAALYKKTTPAADVNNDFAKMVAQWDSGTIGMLNHNLGSYQDHVKALGVEKFSGIPQPVGASGKRVQVSNPVDEARPVQELQEQDAALEVRRVRHLARARTQSSTESAGQVPSNTEAATDAWIQRRGATKLAAEALNDGSTTIVQLPYYLPDWNTISKADNEPNLQKVLLGKMSAKAFLDTMAEQLNEAQAEWNEQMG